MLKAIISINREEAHIAEDSDEDMKVA